MHTWVYSTAHCIYLTLALRRTLRRMKKEEDLYKCIKFFYPLPLRVEMVLDTEEARRKNKKETGGKLTYIQMDKI